MKKILGIIVVLALIALQTGAVFGSTADSAIRVFVHGNEVDFGKYDSVMPRIENGRTLVPIRAITDALGASIAWEEATQTVTIASDANSIVLVIGSYTVNVNGVNMETEAAPVIENGRTLVPLRIISEALKEKVEWNGETRSVIIEKNVPDTIVLDGEVEFGIFDVVECEDRPLEEIMAEEALKEQEDEPTAEELEMGMELEEIPAE